MKMNRERVYEAIDSEREYQDKKWPEPYMSVAETLLYIGFYLQLSRADATNADHEAALQGIRKIAALAVACMEYHGVSERE